MVSTILVGCLGGKALATRRGMPLPLAVPSVGCRRGQAIATG